MGYSPWERAVHMEMTLIQQVQKPSGLRLTFSCVTFKITTFGTQVEHTEALATRSIDFDAFSFEIFVTSAYDI